MTSMRKLFSYSILLIIISDFALTSCGDDDDSGIPTPTPAPEEQIAVTGEVTNLDAFSATVSGSVNVDYADDIAIEYASNQELKNSALGVNSSSKGGKFSINLDDLQPEHTYYYRTYVRINENRYYGDVKSFTTTEVALQKSGAVDLGLSVKWAACNLGAKAPEEYGSYFEWGATTENKAMTYYDKNKTTGSYNSRFTDLGNEISGTQYDAARVQLGNPWRMPTKDEMQELLDKCTNKYLKYKGTEGVLFIAANGNCIFLPATGKKVISYSDNGKITQEDTGVNGNYWSGTIYETLVGPDVSESYTLHFSIYEGVYNAFYNRVMMVSNSFLSEGLRASHFLSIRPVTE